MNPITSSIPGAIIKVHHHHAKVQMQGNVTLESNLVNTNRKGNLIAEMLMKMYTLSDSGNVVDRNGNTGVLTTID
jgi:hypothetical protein